MRREDRAVRCLRGLCVAALFSLTALAAGPTLAVTLSVSSGSGGPGDSVPICVDLASGDRDVAGVQADVVWDAACASVNPSSCHPGNHQKQLHKSLRSSSRLRILVLSLADTDPIPDGTRLFCCDFQISDDVQQSYCPIGLQNLSASDPSGTAISPDVYGGEITIVSTAGRSQPDRKTGGRATGSRPAPVVGGAAPATGGGDAPAPPAAASGSATSGGSGGTAPAVVLATPGQIEPSRQAQPPAAPPAELDSGNAPAVGAAPPAARPAAQPPVALPAGREEGSPVTTPVQLQQTPAAITPVVAASPHATAAQNPTVRAMSALPTVRIARDTPTRAAAHVKPTEPEEKSGCQLDARAHGNVWLLLLAVPLLLPFRRRR